MKTLQETKQSFEKSLLAPIKGQLLVFEGCPGYDVYNCSVPFSWQGKQYIFGRVEQPGIWADSRVLLFEATAEVNYQALPQTVLQLEDPFVCQVDGEW
ncbi:MAG: DUF1861 family protein, partial [Oscillospiraceae bacterium]|nr:DUF1861 family protein [Oscillospiraceae bacterium]